MKFLAAILLLVAFTSAKPMSDPSGCNAPEQFVGRFELYTRTALGKESGNAGAIFYDGGDAQRIRVDVVVKGVSYKVVQNYKERMQYVISADHCYAMAFSQTFHPIAVPAGAQEILPAVRIGTAAHGLNVRRYYGNKEGADYLATFTADECLLTSSVAITPQSKDILFFSLSDISRLEVTDGDFAHPTSCQHVGASAGGEQTEATRAMPLFKFF